MVKSIVILVGAVFWISGCADGREEVKTQGGVTCVKPPPEIFTTDIEAKVDASTPRLGEIAKANLSVNQKVEKLRETLPEVQSFEVLEYRFCRMYTNGLIDKPTYNEMVKQVLPRISTKQPADAQKTGPDVELAPTPKLTLSGFLTYDGGTTENLPPREINPNFSIPANARIQNFRFVIEERVSGHLCETAIIQPGALNSPPGTTMDTTTVYRDQMWAGCQVPSGNTLVQCFVDPKDPKLCNQK